LAPFRSRALTPSKPLTCVIRSRAALAARLGAAALSEPVFLHDFAGVVLVDEHGRQHDDRLIFSPFKSFTA
jgi:hypothetical protein